MKICTILAISGDYNSGLKISPLVFLIVPASLLRIVGSLVSSFLLRSLTLISCIILAACCMHVAVTTLLVWSRIGEKATERTMVLRDPFTHSNSVKCKV